MTALHEAEVRARFDLLHGRFKRSVARDDFRLTALLGALPLLPGLRVLDLGCGKGRFATRLAEAGASVTGLDLSAGMLADAEGIDRVRGSAQRLPFADGSFDAVIAVEVFEHLGAVEPAVKELARVLQPGGMLAVIDKNAGSWNARRPWLPNLLVKWIDERRGRWMYPSRGPVRERWFWPWRFGAVLSPLFREVRVAYLLSPEESAHFLFRHVAPARLYTLWTARRPGGAR